MRKLTRSFYNQNTTLVAQQLLGKLLIHEVNGIRRIGRIVETEAYVGPHDLAAHSSRGITSRTQIMYGSPGYAYVYLIYGIYHCFNVVTEPEGHGSAVLIRALEPVLNIDQRTQGPGLLCRAMGIDKQLNGHDLLGSTFYLAESEKESTFDIVSSKRIGVAYAKEWAESLLRFYIKDNPYVSKR